MIDMLEHQFWRNCIPHYLEEGDTTEVPSHVANKTGSLDHVRNDVGLVFTRDGPTRNAHRVPARFAIQRNDVLALQGSDPFGRREFTS